MSAVSIFQGLEVFVAVVDAGGFSAAARRLGLSKSFVSETVKQLEEQLGVRLLDRTTRSMSVTEAGQAVHERASRALEEVRHAQAEAQQHQTAPRGRLRVAVFEGFHRFGLLAHLGEFLDANPSLQIEFIEGAPAVNLVDEGIDLAIRVTPQPDPGLIVRRLGVSRVVIVASPGYLARAGEPTQPSDLADHRVLAFAPLYLAREWRFIVGGRPMTVPVNPTLLTNTSETLRVAVLEGLGLAALPLWSVHDALGDGRLLRLLPDFALPESGVYAVYASNRLMTAKVTRFVDHLSKHLPQTITFPHA